MRKRVQLPGINYSAYLTDGYLDFLNELVSVHIIVKICSNAHSVADSQFKSLFLLLLYEQTERDI